MSRTDVQCPLCDRWFRGVELKSAGVAFLHSNDFLDEKHLCGLPSKDRNGAKH